MVPFDLTSKGSAETFFGRKKDFRPKKYYFGRKKVSRNFGDPILTKGLSTFMILPHFFFQYVTKKKYGVLKGIYLVGIHIASRYTLTL
jgi:hypothetical protein